MQSVFDVVVVGAGAAGLAAARDLIEAGLSVMVLEGSHKLEGTGISDLHECPVAQIEAPRGSVVYFTETLMHTAVPILSETRRYVMFYGYVPPWFEVWHGGDVPKEIVDSYDDVTIKKIIGGDDQWGYNGQTQV